MPEKLKVLKRLADGVIVPFSKSKYAAELKKAPELRQFVEAEIDVPTREEKDAIKAEQEAKERADAQAELLRKMGGPAPRRGRKTAETDPEPEKKPEAVATKPSTDKAKPVTSKPAPQKEKAPDSAGAGPDETETPADEPASNAQGLTSLDPQDWANQRQRLEQMPMALLEVYAMEDLEILRADDDSDEEFRAKVIAEAASLAGVE